MLIEYVTCGFPACLDCRFNQMPLSFQKDPRAPEEKNKQILGSARLREVLRSIQKRGSLQFRKRDIARLARRKLMHQKPKKASGTPSVSREHLCRGFAGAMSAFATYSRVLGHFAMPHRAPGCGLRGSFLRLRAHPLATPFSRRQAGSSVRSRRRSQDRGSHS